MLLRLYLGKSDQIEVPKNQKLEKNLITPTTKGETDELISEKDVVEANILTQEQWDTCAKYALQLFKYGQQKAAENGLILVDTKYEFGMFDDELIVIDEIHTPDSSRYWIKDEYLDHYNNGENQKMLDKENIRQWLIEHNFSGEGNPPDL